MNKREEGGGESKSRKYPVQAVQPVHIPPIHPPQINIVRLRGPPSFPRVHAMSHVIYDYRRNGHSGGICNKYP